MGVDGRNQNGVRKHATTICKFRRGDGTATPVQGPINSVSSTSARNRTEVTSS